MKKLKKNLEHIEQVNLFKWASLLLKKYPELELLYAIPNGGQRSITTAIALKAEGVKAGMPDVVLPVDSANKQFCALFIEMKVKPNKPTPQQIQKMALLEKYHNKCVVCYSWREAANAIFDYLGYAETID
jgi:hypothetical protein